MKKTASGIMLILLFVGVLTLAFNIQPVKASGTIYIRADGSVDPPTAPIQRDGNLYTFTNNINDSIVVERDNIVIDGASYTLQGTGAYPSKGIDLTGRTNVTVRDTQIKNFWYGIYLFTSSQNRIIGNNITANNGYGIWLDSFSNNNRIIGNNITANNYDGISLLYSSQNRIIGNNITANGVGIDIDASTHNIVSGNNIKNNGGGIELSDSSNNSISRNEITNNDYAGIRLISSFNNIVSENNIAKNGGGLRLTLYTKPGKNSIYHNNFLNNTKQACFGYIFHFEQPITSFNFWNDGYPSGGNYWSDYNGTDSYSGAYQNETGSDSIGDTPYIIDADNRDNYPLMSLWTPPEHEVVATITAPPFMRLGDSISLEAIVTNEGLNDEANVELELLINGTIVDSKMVSKLKTYFPQTLSHLWTPTMKGIYNVTAYARPVSGETSIENNRVSKIIIVGPPLEVGVKAGEWVRYDYTYTNAPSGTPLPTWIKVEFLSVEETTATVQVTMHMSDGTEQNQTMTMDVVAGGGTIGTFTGFLIPANSKTGYPIYISGYANLTIAGETTRMYAGASRKVVYTTFSQYGTQLTYYWDKQTGVMVEASASMGGMTATAKAMETNMWEAEPIWMQWWLWAIVAVVIVALAGAVYLLKKRKPPTPTAPTPSAEGT